jgi:hypothetical protein
MKITPYIRNNFRNKNMVQRSFGDREEIEAFEQHFYLLGETAPPHSKQVKMV